MPFHPAFPPRWLITHLSTVQNIESRLKMSICDQTADKVLAESKVPIKFLKDGKQRREWYEFTKGAAGKVMLTWRYEPFDEEKPEFETGEVLGSFQLTGAAYFGADLEQVELN